MTDFDGVFVFPATKVTEARYRYCFSVGGCNSVNTIKLLWLYQFLYYHTT